jgi:hypothetical protein
MSRIEPIPRSHALVFLARRAPSWDGRGQAAATVETPRRRRSDARARSPLGDGAAAAAFEVHRLASGYRRGLKADLGVRRQWASAYATAAHASGSETDTMEWARA